MSVEFRVVAAVMVATIGCLLDLRTRRIPNMLTLGAAVGAIAFLSLTAGLHGFGSAITGWAVGAAVFLPFFLLGGMGAGDVKLMAAIGAWLGPLMVLWSALYAAIAGGVLAVILAFGHGYLRTALVNLGAALAFWKTVGLRPVPTLTLASASGPRLTYAVPVLIGTVIALWLR